MEWPEAIQGFFVAGATGLSLIPIMQGYFGFTFEMGLAVVIVQSVLIATAPLIWGDPYCHGWVTPAIPLVLAAVVAKYTELGGVANAAGASPDVITHVIKFVTAFTLLCAAFFLVAGITGLGRVIVERIARPLKAGIIFGAAIAAFLHEFEDARITDGLERVRLLMFGTDGDADRIAELTTALTTNHSYFDNALVSSTLAIGICLVLMFSVPLSHLKARMRWIALLAGLGLAPGFITAAVTGYITGEITFAPEMGIERPPFGEMWNTLSPLAIGFPTGEMFLAALPLAIVVYIIGFGDMITGNELLYEAHRHRPDEKFDINPTRTHLNCGIRNAVQALVAGPFPVTHGPLWTGVQVVVTERYKQGREAMDTIFGGIGAYYFWGVPLLLFLTPITSFLQPLLPVALSITILLTGFACGYVAMALPRNNVERGVAVTTGMVLALFGAWQGLAMGIVLTLTMCGWPTSHESDTAEE